MVCILKPYDEVLVPPYEVEHTIPELNRLVSLIQSLDGEVRIVMEATGAYHLPLVTRFKEAGMFVSVVNPYIRKKYVQSEFRKGKTDKIDSIRIAKYGIDKWFKLVDFTFPEEVYSQLRLLGRQYAHYITLKVESKLALTSILDQTMPGLKRLLKSNRSEVPTKDKLADFVEQYWHFDNIKNKSEAQFIRSYNSWAKKKGYYAKESQAKAIYALALESIPTLPSSASSTKMLTLEAVRVLKEINRTLETILTQMQEIATSLPEYDIDSPPFQSGSFTGSQRGISKRGSSLLRKTGYEVMKCLKTSKPTEDAAVYLYMLKKEAEGKPKKVAKIAALNKFLRIYYARVKAVYLL